MNELSVREQYQDGYSWASYSTNHNAIARR